MINFSQYYQKNRQLVWGISVGVVSYVFLRYTPFLVYSPIDIFSLQSLVETAYVISWNLALITYLTLTFRMMARTESHQIVRRSKNEYESKRNMFIMVIASGISSVVAIVRELSIISQKDDWQVFFHLSLSITTIITSWLFIHTIFALYYAHFFYHVEHDSDFPLDFPHDSHPDYFDFVYFAFGIGISGQTSDVSFTSKQLRRVGTVHAVLAFFFNTAILALMIELGAGLIN